MTLGVAEAGNVTGPTVCAGIPRGLMNLAVAKGADRDELFRRSGLTDADFADQDNRIPMPRYVALIRAAAELTQDAAIGLHYGEAVDLSEVSIAGLLANSSETMGEAFQQINRFGRLAIEVEGVEPDRRFVMAVHDGGVWLVDKRGNPNEFPELTEVTFARMTHPRRFLPKPYILEVHLTHAEPIYRAEYDRIFQCPVKFGTSWNAMRLDPELATYRVRLQPEYVFGVLSERAEELLKQLQGSKTARGQVEALLMPILHTGEINMDTVAGRMGVSRPTLFRRLKEENTTYEQVLDELRHRLALHYLDGKKVSVNETGYLVGFSEPSAFSRAFKRWTGKSPRNRD